MRGAEIGSDHYLVLMVIKLKVKVEKPIIKSREVGKQVEYVRSIHVEMVKAGGYTVVQWLKDIFDIAWKGERYLTNGGKLSLYLSTRRAVEMSVVTTEE